MKPKLFNVGQSVTPIRKPTRLEGFGGTTVKMGEIYHIRSYVEFDRGYNEWIVNIQENPSFFMYLECLFAPIEMTDEQIAELVERYR